MEVPIVDIYNPIASSKIGPPPSIVNILVTTSNAGAVGGVPSKTQTWEQYIRLGSLPKELQEKIKIALQCQQY